MAEKKHMLKFRKDGPVESDPSPPETIDDKMERARDKYVPASNQASEKQTATKTTIEDQAKKPSSQPTNVSEEIHLAYKAYKGDFAKIWKFIIENFEGEEAATAGYQVCLLQTNIWIARWQRIFEIPFPFDPRIEHPLLAMMETQSPVETKEAPMKEEFTSKREQRLAELHAQIDNTEVNQ